MRAGMLAFCAGVMLAGFLPRLPAPLVIGFMGLLALLLARQPRLRMPAACLAGVVYLCCWGQLGLRAQFPAADATLDLVVQGTVWSVPQRTERGWRLLLRMEASCGRAARTCQSLLWHEQRLLQVSVYSPLQVAPGQRWQWLLRLRRPQGFVNPGGFDQEAWLLQRGIAATGYVRTSAYNRSLPAGGTGPWFERLRHRLATQLDASSPPLLLHGNLINALALGLQQGITARQWDDFTQLGLNHLVVISGLHLALVTALLYRCGLLLARLWPQSLLYLTAPCFAAAMALAGALGYAGLAGFGLPAKRALVMAAVFLGGRLFSRQTSTWLSLQLALLLVLLLDPLAPQSAGFWLSFVAVAVLLAQDRSAAGNSGSRLLQALRIQGLLSLGLLPLMLLFFQQASLLAPLVNLPAIPWVGLLVVPLCLAGVLLLQLWPQAALPLLQASDFLLDCFLRAVAGIAAVAPAALVSLPPPTAPLLLALSGIAVLLLYRPLALPWRLAALALLPPILLWPRQRLAHGELELTVMDVGQGLAVHVGTRHQQLLYDTGPRYSERFDAGEDVVLPVLRRLGVRRLDTVIVSHPDGDHAGGLPAIIEAFPQARYLGSDLSIFTGAGNVAYCRPTEWWRDGFRFRLLHPDTTSYSRNDASCVLHISGEGGSIMLPGDIGRAVEQRLLQAHPELQADLLLAPHHGSKTSSSLAFVRRLRPTAVVFSTGHLNSFGHPAAEVQERYARAGSAAFNTADDGAVRVRIGPGAGIMQIGTQRELQPRFWRRTSP